MGTASARSSPALVGAKLGEEGGRGKREMSEKGRKKKEDERMACGSHKYFLVLFAEKLSCH